MHGDGIDVRGYLHWTLLDNFEWTAGFAKTFGLVAVDRQTFARTVKPTARWLGQVAARQRSRLTGRRGQAGRLTTLPSMSKPTRSVSGCRRARSKP